MAVFSTNQNRHLYVATTYATTVNDESAVGVIGQVTAIDAGPCKEVYFLYRGPEGVQKSDRIQVKNLDYIKDVAAADMAMTMKKVKLSLNANPVVGQDYILRIVFRQFYGMSDQDQYIKDAAVHVTSAINTKALFMQAMKDALDKAFSREVGATISSNPYLSFTVTNDDLFIEEKEQDWALGVGAVQRVYFDVIPTTIYDGNDDVIWGTAEPVSGGATVNNGKLIADLEWFCMGERGDQYRYMGYPNYIPTKYLVDPTSAYNVLEIHHAFTDTGVNSYRSEKDITVASATAATITSLKAAILTAAGIETE